jgi:hypothetical protein
VINRKNLIIVTPDMKKKYELYGYNDVVLDDLTYKTNRLELPVWARVGISSSERTILFGICIV